jgi:hypothetical protein
MGDPGLLGLDRLRSRLDVEQHRREVDPGDAVDHGVMGLGDQGEALALQALDQPELPQRFAAVELLGEDAADQLAQLRLASGRRERRVAHVVGDVEAGIVDPEGPPGLRRR